jgi:hypothetical protein
MALKGRGGAGRGQGRKPKADEDRIRTLSINALTDVYGSEIDAMKHLAEESKIGGKEGFPYLKLLLEYAYGKPKETIDLTNKVINISFDE